MANGGIQPLLASLGAVVCVEEEDAIARMSEQVWEYFNYQSDVKQ